MIYLFKRPLSLLGIVVLSLAVISLLVNASTRPAYEKTMKKEGWPTNFSELEQMWYPPLSPEENGAEEWLEAGLRLSQFVTPAFRSGMVLGEASPEMDAEQKLLLSPELRDLQHYPRDLNLLTPEQRQAIEAYISESEVLDVIRTAAGKAASRFDVNFENLYTGNGLSHLALLGQVDKFLSLLEVRSILHTDVPGYLEALKLHVSLVNALREEPLQSSQYNRRSFIADLVRGVEWGLSHLELTREQLDQVKDTLEAIQAFPEVVARAQMTEFLGMKRYVEEPWRDFGRLSLNGFEISPSDAALAFSVYLPLIASGYVQMGTKAATRAHRMLIAQAESTPFPTIQQAQQIDKKITRMAFLSPMAAIVMPSSLYNLGKSAMDLHLAKTALAVEQFRLAHARLPETLEELVPEYFDAVPNDFYGAGKIGFEQVEGGYILSSWGFNRSNESRLDHDRRRNADILFEVQSKQ